MEERLEVGAGSRIPLCVQSINMDEVQLVMANVVNYIVEGRWLLARNGNEPIAQQ